MNLSNGAHVVLMVEVTMNIVPPGVVVFIILRRSIGS